MGKLVEKLQQIGQGASGSLGFMPRRDNGAVARPAAVLVTLRAADASVAEAVTKAGVDAIIIAGWKPGANISAVKNAIESGQALWGVQYNGAGDDEPVKAAREAGASFILLGEDAAVGALFEENGQMDRVVTISPPQNEMDLLTLRVINALPAQVAIVALPAGVADLSALPVPAFAQLAIIAESLRFPLLALVNDEPDQSACRALVRLGVDGIVLPGVGIEADTLANQVRAVRANLEKTPPRSQREGVNLSGLLGAAGATPGKPAPEVDPDEK
jgi:DNA-binding NarL/FixJ family response regulator